MSTILASLAPDHLVKDPGCDVGAQGIHGHQIHVPREQVLQIEDQVHEVIEGWLLELDKHVHVAGLVLVTPGMGAEYPVPPNALGIHLGPVPPHHFYWIHNLPRSATS